MLRPGSTIGIGIGGRLREFLALSAWLIAIAPASAQQPPPTNPNPNPGQAAQPAPDLSTKYRFYERYSVGNEPAAPGALGAYRVGLLDSTVTKSVDQPGGTPERVEVSYQAVFAERAAGVNSLDDKIVTDVVRRYEKVRLTNSERPADYKLPVPPYLDGLTLWIKAGIPKKIYSLTEGRRLRVGDFDLAEHQVFIPGFAYTLPDIDCRIGDSWQLAPTGVFVLLGGYKHDSGVLMGRLQEVRVDPKTQTKTAIFKITGTVKFGPAESAVNAEIHFNFATQEAATPTDAAKKAAETVVEARGGIVKIRLGQSTAGLTLVDDPKDQKRFTSERNFQFQRQLRLDGPALDPPAATVQATEENSWLTYVDPKGRFEFRFPQDMRQISVPPGFLMMRGSDAEGLDRISLTPIAKSDPLSTPDAMRKARMEDLENEWEVTPGTGAYLPEADWPKLRVYRWDTFLRPKSKDAPSQRTTLLLGYSILTGRDMGFYVEASSNREPLLPIRGEVEAIIHSLVVDPPQKK